MESIGMATLEIFRSDCSTEGGECNFPKDIEVFFSYLEQLISLRTSLEVIISGTTICKVQLCRCVKLCQLGMFLQCYTKH